MGKKSENEFIHGIITKIYNSLKSKIYKVKTYNLKVKRLQGYPH